MIAMGWSRFLTGDTGVVGGDGFLRLLLFCFCLIEVILPLHVQFCSPHQVDLIKPIADFFTRLDSSSLHTLTLNYLGLKIDSQLGVGLYIGEVFWQQYQYLGDSTQIDMIPFVASPQS
jgi:hypothetical protein